MLARQCYYTHAVRHMCHDIALANTSPSSHNTSIVATHLLTHQIFMEAILNTQNTFGFKGGTNNTHVS